MFVVERRRPGKLTWMRHSQESNMLKATEVKNHCEQHCFGWGRIKYEWRIREIND